MRRPAVELPTLLLACVIHAAWLVLTLYAADLPWWLVMPLGGFVVAWHGSLQHETIHGHPTRWRAVNELVGSAPLGLWMPYRLYREDHLAHHRTGVLTDPIEDPESFYVTGAAWATMGPARRALAWACTTLVGRIVLGPPVLAVRFSISEMRRVASGDFRRARAWAMHLTGVALLVVWLDRVCGLSFGRYVLTFAYPGLALTLLRSFAEHRPAATNALRVGLVEANPIAGLLYLNNNLHVVHHDEPSLPWYAIPAKYRAARDEILAKNGGFTFSGYAELFARYGLRPKDPPVHPAG